MMFECIDKIYPSVSIDTVSGAICSFTDEYGGLPLKSCTSLISGYQEGSGTPSPSNVRPLVSFSSAILTATGENIADIADKATSTTEGIESTITDSKLVASGQSTGNGDIRVLFNNPLIIKQGMTIYFSIDGTDNRSSLLYVFLHRKGGSYLSPTSIPNTSHSITLTTEGVYDHMLLRTTINQTVNIDAYIMIGTSTEYVPYVGNTYTFTFGQSIYQGYIDWKRGVVTAKWGYIASYNGETLTGEWLCNKAPYEVGTTPPTGSQVAYELATPIVIPLGGINLLTQQGVNNIFADCGDSTVEYIKIN